MVHDRATVTLWTAQRQVVLDTLIRDGVYMVKRTYIDEKYQETAWIFREAYSFFRETASSILPPPEEAQSGIWLYQDLRWAGATADSLVLRLEVPVEQAIFFDLRLWNRILNLQFLGKDLQEEQAFARELERLGLKSTMPLFQTPYYPLQRRAVRQSWKRLFEQPLPPETYRQAAVWVLEKEWLREVKYPEGTA